MKKIAFAFLLSTVILGACSKDDDPTVPSKPAELGIDVQSYFKQTPVQVFVDGKVILNATLTTDLSSGYAQDGGKVLTTIPTGDHQVSTIVNNDATHAESFLVAKNHYIGINFDSLTNTVRFVHSDTPFVYR